MQPQQPQQPHQLPPQPPQQEQYQHPQAPTPETTSIFSILGLIFAFIFVPFGLLFSIIGIIDSGKPGKKGRGLGIAGLIISILWFVLVIGGTLLLLTLNTQDGVQQRARDAQRQTDLNAVRAQLEVFFSNNGYYPASANDLTTQTLTGIDIEALKDPDGGSWEDGPAGPNQQYGYVTLPQGCQLDCSSYTLSVWLEATLETYEKQSLFN